MTLWRNLVVALVAAFALAACSGSDSGPTQAELDAANAAKAAAEAEAAAAKQAAEEAAAAAEAEAAAAKQAAEEAAAAAARAAEEARQQVIAEQEKQAVMDAVAAAMASVGGLMDDSSDADVAGAAADIAAATAAIAAAATLSADDMAMYNAQVAEIQANLTLAEANIRAYRAEMAAEEANQQATAAERAKMAVDAATTALNTATGAQGMSQTAYEAAVAAQAAAQSAVANANSETLADASAALAEALIASASAAADLAVKTQAVADATTALQMARDTLAEVDPDHVALQAANAALAKAATDAEAQAAKIKALEDEIARLKQAEADRQQAARDEAEKERMMAMAADGKALHGALGETPLSNLDLATSSLDTSGLVISTDGTATTEDVTLEAGDSAGSLGAWTGTHYAHMDPGTKVSNAAVVYTNQSAPKSEPFSDVHTLDTNEDFLTVADANLSLVMADDFTHSGTQTHTVPDRGDAVYVDGTYDGAPGVFRCATGCSSTNDGTGSPSALGGTWTFTPADNAMVSQADAIYLYFGWWLTKDKDDEPTSASAFFGEVGDVEGGGTFTDPATITGSATYAGKAAGKFAIYNPLDGTGEAGHFTANAMLTAKFGDNTAPNNGGVTGTIDNFMANDEMRPWSVELQRAQWDGTTAGAFASIPDDTSTTDVDESTATVWSIDGNSAAPSGSWNGQMHDDALAPAAADDGSTVPTAAVGVFHAEFGSIGRMVGGFGAEKQ